MELTLKEANFIVDLIMDRKDECETIAFEGDEGRERLSAKVEMRLIAALLDKFNAATL